MVFCKVNQVVMKPPSDKINVTLSQSPCAVAKTLDYVNTVKGV